MGGLHQTANMSKHVTIIIPIYLAYKVCSWFPIYDACGYIFYLHVFYVFICVCVYIMCVCLHMCNYLCRYYVGSYVHRYVRYVHRYVTTYVCTYVYVVRELSVQARKNFPFIGCIPNKDLIRISSTTCLSAWNLSCKTKIVCQMSVCLWCDAG